MTTWSTWSVAVEVVIEEQVTGLERVERHVGESRPLRLGRPRDGDARLAPGPLHEAGAVEAHAGLLAAEDVGHAELGHRRLHGRHPGAPARGGSADRPGSAAGLVGRRRSRPRRSRSHRPLRPRLPPLPPQRPPVAAPPRSAPPPRPPLPAAPLEWPLSRLPGPAGPAPGSGSPSSWRPLARWPAPVTSPGPPPTGPAPPPPAARPPGPAGASRTAAARSRPWSGCRRSGSCTGCAPRSAWPTWRSRRRTRSRVFRRRRPATASFATSSRSTFTAERAWTRLAAIVCSAVCAFWRFCCGRVVLVVEDGGLLLLLGQRRLYLADLRLGGVDLRLVRRGSGQRGGGRRARVRRGRRRQQRGEQADDHGHPDKRSPPADSAPTIHCIHGATA